MELSRYNRFEGIVVRSSGWWPALRSSCRPGLVLGNSSSTRIGSGASLVVAAVVKIASVAVRPVSAAIPVTVSEDGIIHRSDHNRGRNCGNHIAFLLIVARKWWIVPLGDGGVGISRHRASGNQQQRGDDRGTQGDSGNRFPS